MGAALVYAKDKVLVIGGKDRKGTVFRAVSSHNLTTDSWEVNLLESVTQTKVILAASSQRACTCFRKKLN